MDSLLVLGAEIMIIGICVWVVVTETKSAAEISRMLDMPSKPKKARFPELAAAAPAPPSSRPSRPGRRH